ncbi:MAG: hypothetical protein ACREMA_14635, partial [Longimicrobiales bacterium]
MARDKPYEQALQGLETGPEASDAAAASPSGAAGDAAAHPSVAALRQKFGANILHHVVYAGDEHTVFVAAEKSRTILGWLKD